MLVYVDKTFHNDVMVYMMLGSSCVPFAYCHPISKSEAKQQYAVMK